METTYAYLAGAIDIDGFIYIARRKGTRQDGQGGIQYFARIGLSDASPVVPNLLQALFPGRVSQSRPKKSSYAAFYIWEADHQQAREPLLRMLPNLRLKRRHAELALELMDLIESQNAGRSMTKPLSAEQDATRRRLYEEVARLNAARSRRKYRVEAPADL